MIKLSYKDQHKSITKFNPIELPQFTVLTGVNGAGKTHFLQAIAQGNVVIEETEDPHIVPFNYETFRLENESAFNAQQLFSERQAAWKTFNERIKNEITTWKNALEGNYAKFIEVANVRDKSLWGLTKKDFEEEDLFKKLAWYKKQISDHFRKNNKLKDNTQAHEILVLKKKLPYSIDEIKEDDFLGLYKPFSFKNDFLPFQLGKVFTDYFSKYDLNRYNRYRNTDYGENHHILTDKEFLKIHGEKPWDLVNKILEKFNSIYYKVNSPENLTRDDSFQIRLDHTTKKSVNPQFDELSSGERTLMALVASIYKSSSDNHFPDILLLDEIDASLHPSMIQNLLDVVNDIFLKKDVHNFFGFLHSQYTGCSSFLCKNAIDFLLFSEIKLHQQILSGKL